MAECGGSIVGAIILAGGKSERMGRDKALLPYRGTTLLAYVLAVVSQIEPQVVVVADRTDKYAVPCPVIADAFPDCGPVGGIVTGLHYLGAGAHLVAACDMPHLHPDILRYLLECAIKGDYDAVVPETDGRPEPLCAVYRDTCLAPLTAFLQSGQRAAHRALLTLNVLRIDTENLRPFDPELACFTNFNTPEDLP